MTQADLFLQDVLSEPATLAHVLDTYGAAVSPLDEVPAAVDRVRFYGMGSSRFAALPVASLLREAGLDAAVERSSVVRGTPATPGTLAICVSAGGESPETVAHAVRHRGTSSVVALTNVPTSTLAREADVVLPLEAGEERGGVACRTYQATLVVLLLLARRFGARVDDLTPAVDLARRLLDGRDDWLDDVTRVVGGSVAVLAPEERISSAEQGALMLREGPRIPAVACETGDWSHVEVYLTKRPGYRALVFSGSPHERRFVEWMRARGGEFVSVGTAVPGAAAHVPLEGTSACSLLVETTVAELVAAELWRRSLSDA